MLSIKFELEAGPTVAAELQARALVTTLHALFGDAILPSSLSVTNRIGEVAVTVSGQPQAVKTHLAASTAPAPDGYPSDDPAAAFGETAPENPAAAFGEEAPAPAGADVERDADGIPYDKRIHAETKTKTAKGIWTRRRNTPDDTFNAVMAELKQANTARTLTAAATIPAPPVGGAVPLPPGATAPTTPAAPAPSPAPAAPGASSTAPGGPVPPELSEPADTFPKMMVKITAAQRAKLLDVDTLAGILAAAGAEPAANGQYSMMAMNKNPALIPIVDSLLSEHLAG